MTIEIANRLCAYRKQHGLSQEELAEKIGVSRQAVSKWERAEASPDTDNLILLAQVYGVTLDELLHADSSKEEKEPVFSVKENGHIFAKEQEEQSDFRKRWNKVPWPLFCVAAYLLMGCFEWCGGWGLGWMVFLTIPLYYTLGEAIDKGAASHFAYPVLVTLIYLILGFLWGLWHPGWVVFVTIPAYYAICGTFEKEDAKQETDDL